MSDIEQGKTRGRPKALAPFAATPAGGGNGGNGGNGGGDHLETAVALDDFRPPPVETIPHEGPIEAVREADAPHGSRGRRVVRHLMSAVDLRGIGKKGGYGATPLILLTVLALVEGFSGVAFSQSLIDLQRKVQTNIGSIIQVVIYSVIAGILLTGVVGYVSDRWKRARMSAIGGIITSLGAIATALAPTKGLLVTARAFAIQGQVIAQPAQFSLVADYYPLEERGRAFAFQTIGEQIGLLIAPIFVGIIGTVYGWEYAFYIIGAVGVLASLLLLRLKEPVRGYHERRDHGAEESVALTEQEPPSWGEAWRGARSIRTLRRISYSFIFTRLATLGIGIYLFIYVLPRVYGLDILERGYVGVMEAAAGILGLMVGGPLVGRLIKRNPGRVTMLNGAAGIIGAFCVMGIAVTRTLWVALVFIALYAFVDFIILPAQLAVSSVVTPPRMRGLARATLAYWSLPAYLVGLPVLGYVSTEYGSRAGLILFAPIMIIGAIIYMTAGPYVEFDIKSATAAAMADEEWRKAKAAGRGKLLVMRDVDVHYETVQVLFEVDLDVHEGELLALLGTNGAGKSTLLRAISGTQQATGGAIVFDGRDITHVPPHESVRYGVVHMPGGRGVFPGLSVAENLKLAGWMYGQDPKHQQEVEQVFEYFPVLRERIDLPAGTLSGGEQQMLSLAQVFLSRPRLLMIDELSLGLSPAVVAQLLEIITAIHERGTTIILVEQSVNVALTVAKRAIFMEKGEIRFDGPTEELLERPDIMRAVFLKGAGALTNAIRESSAGDEDMRLTTGQGVRMAPLAERPVVLSAEGIVLAYGGVRALDGVDMHLREQEILGLIGPNGAGKTTLLEVVSGFATPNEGRVIYDGRDITDLRPDERARMRLIRRFQDARLFPSLTVSETIAVSFERDFDSRSIFVEGLQLPQARVSELRVRKRVDRLIDLLELGDYRDKFVSELSTGSRRIVDLACVLASEPKVLLLDEPSSGLAQREAENLVPMLLRVRKETGCSILIVEHDMPLISALADELMAMVLGKPVVRGEANMVLENDEVVRAYLGTSQDAIARSGRGKD